MRATFICLAALLGLALTGGTTSAQCVWYPIPQAPDACCPGYYVVNYWGAVYGPNYNLTPPYPPFQGMVCPPNNGNGGGQQPAFPTHPYARSPRDFFMYYDK